MEEVENKCDECGQEIKFDPEARQPISCGCGTFKALCEHCGQPHNNDMAVCNPCWARTMAKD